MSEETVEAPEAGSLTAELPSEGAADVAVEAAPEVNLDDIPQWLHDYKDLGPEILQEPSLKLVDSNEKLLKGYVNAQKAIGANKVVIPGKHAEFDGPEWQEVFHKLGLPSDLDGYEVQGKDENDEFLKAYKEFSMNNKVLPQQAQAMYDWFHERGMAQLGEQEKAQADELVAQQESLKTEWGDKYERNVQLAQIAVRSVDNPDFIEYLDSSGLATNPQLIKAFAKLGESMYEEAQIVDGGTKSPLQNTKEAAEAQLREIYEDQKHPIYNKSHPGHARARQEVRQLHLRKNM